MKDFFKGNFVKNICYSLLLVVVFVCLNPSLFLTKTAKWTYKNQQARIDIVVVTKGSSNINVEGISFKTPKWFNKNNNQGSVIEFPVSYSKTSHSFDIVPVFKEKNATIRIKFMGQDFRHNKQRKKALVSYKNITVNGQKIKDSTKVWHDGAFIYEVNQNQPEQITVSFDVKKPFSSHSIKWSHVLKVFLGAFAVVFLLECCKQEQVKSILLKYSDFDLVDYLWNKYKSIDPVYHKSFWTIFVVLNITFGFHTINFMYGNHDWRNVVKVPLLQDISKGRYSLDVFLNLFFDGNIIPVLSNLIFFFLFSLSVILLFRYWNLPKKTSTYILCGLLFLVQGFILPWFYYITHYLDCPWFLFIIVLSFLFSEKSLGWNRTKKIIVNIIIIVMLHYVISGYPAWLNGIAVILLGKIFIDCLNKKEITWTDLKALVFKKHFLYLCDLFVAGITYKLIFNHLDKIGKISHTYMTDGLPINQIPNRLVNIVMTSLKRLFSYEAPFMPNCITIAFLILLFLLIGYICFQKRKVIEKFGLIFILFVALIASNCSSLLSQKNMSFVVRCSFVGFLFFRLLIVVVLFQISNGFKWIKQLLCLFVIYVSIINDGIALRTWYRGFEVEKMMWNRMLARLEIQDDFNPQKKYFIIQIGKDNDARTKFYKSWKGENYNPGLLGYSYSPYWRPFEAQSFYYPINFAKGRFSGIEHKKNKIFKNCIRKLYEKGILQKSKQWPHKNGLIVYDDIILINYDGKVLSKIIDDMEKGKNK